MTNTITTPLYYMIEDGQDGTASLKLFETAEARDKYIEHITEKYGYGDMSEGGGTLDQRKIDNAMSLADVLELEL